MIFLASCATSDQERINAAAEKEATANQVDNAIKQVKKIPPQPDDCRKVIFSGVVNNDRLDIALIKTDKALSRANDRIKRCAIWYDDLKKHREGATHEE